MSKNTENAENSGGNMTLRGHLRELRNRLIVCIVCFVVFVLIGLYLAPRFVDILTSMGRELGYTFVYLSPQELMLQYFSASFVLGICCSLPVIFYEIWAFIRPGLRENENRIFLGAMIFGFLCFAIGVAFAYKIMLPFTLRFLVELSSGTDITASVSIGNYISFLLTVFLVFGIVFELPVVSVLLTNLGLLKTAWMKKGQRVMIVVIFFIAAVITPPDVVSQIMVAIPMTGLYELSIVLCGIAERRRANKTEANTANTQQL